MSSKSCHETLYCLKYKQRHYKAGRKPPVKQQKNRSVLSPTLRWRRSFKNEKGISCIRCFGGQYVVDRRQSVGLAMSEVPI